MIPFIGLLVGAIVGAVLGQDFAPTVVGAIVGLAIGFVVRARRNTSGATRPSAVADSLTLIKG